MSPGAHHSVATLGALEPGTHLCAFHRDEGQLSRIAATFIGHGLSAGDQILYVTPDGRTDVVLDALPGHVHARDALAAGQLLVRSFEDAYGLQPPDDLGSIAEGFRAAADDARKGGFPGLRVAARMDGLAPLLGSDEAVLQWERMSTGMQRELGVSSVCLYDAGRLHDEHAARLVGEHAGLAPEVAEAPLARFLAVEEPYGMRVSGEVDISNRDLLHRMLLSRAAVTPRMHVDLDGVTFADVGTLSRLRAVAASLPDSGWLALDRVPPAVRRVLSLSGLHHERLLLEP